MSHVARRYSLALIGLFAAFAVTPAVRAQTCSEACLKNILHRYLVALPSHDPKSLPLAAHVDAHENANPVKLGEGSWQSITGVLPGYEFADSETGNVVYGGGVRRGDGDGLLFLRLRIQNGKIIESEMLTNGPGAVTPLPPPPPPAGTAPAGPLQAGQGNPPPDLAGLLTPDILYDIVVPKDRRSAREQLRQIPLLYMEAFAKGDGSIVPFGPRCDRWAVGGRRLTRNVTCAGVMDAIGRRGAPPKIIDRRVVVVDVPHGIAVDMLVVRFNAGGTAIAQYGAHIFKVVDGQVRSIEEFEVVGRMPPPKP